MGNRLHTIRKLTKYTNFHTRLQFVYAVVIGKLIYCLPLYTQANKNQISKIHKVIMTSARAIIGSFCFKKSTKYILDKTKLLSGENMIKYTSIKYLHKIMADNKIQSILSLYKQQNRRKNDHKLRCIYKPKTKKMESHVIYKGAQLLNNLPIEMKKRVLKQ